MITVAGLSAVTIFVPHHPGILDVDDFGVLFPPLLWVGARCRPVFAAAAAFIASVAIVWATTFGIGILGNAASPVDQRVLTAQLAMVALSICAFVLASLFAERRRHVATLTQHEAQLSAALAKATAADRAKSSFLAAASHDLRQPMQTLETLLGTLPRQPEDSEGNKTVTAMARSLQTMSTMLNTLLDINQLETGNLRPSLKEFPINDIFDGLALDFRGTAEEKGLEWRLVRSRYWVRSDPRMLEGMIRNLISNAVRYTDRGRILMGCRRAGDKVSIEVWDSGVGIAGDQIPLIFEEHYQASQTAQHGGFGLGLAIVRRLGNLLGHRIDVRSKPGKGSGFAIEVPGVQQRADFTDQSGLLPNTDSPIIGTILIIEYETSVRAALVSLLTSEGLDVVSVATGDDALVLVAEKQTRPVLIVCDYNLPGKMDGLRTVEALRRALAQKVPSIILTGDSRSDVLEKISAQDIVVAIKPMRADEFLSLLRRLCRRSNPSDSTTGTQPAVQAGSELPLVTNL